MDLPFWVWVVTVGILGAVVVADLIHVVRKPHSPSLKEAGTWSLVYIAAAFIFAIGLFFLSSATYAGEFVAGYVTEKALSVDNLFVFLLIMQAFLVPKHLQQMVLMVGIVLAIVFRSGFIAVGAVLISHFSWVFLIFGVILAYTAWHLVKQGAMPNDFEPNALMKQAQKRLPFTQEYHGTKLWVRIKGRYFLTPLVLVMIAIGSTDILFALDSIPAIFGLTQEPYLVFAATAFALMGLRQLYFVLAGLLEKLKHLSLGLSIILGWIGVKLVLHGLHENTLGIINNGQPVGVPEVPTWLSLGVIFGVLTAVVVVNWVELRRNGENFRSLFVEDNELVKESLKQS
ncbi:TerC/Alx family metal homeostasis membrane protein [Natronoglycomyces albus]|uniref:TerC/Alx family metal homeostasis membrane protein n=1 Tax=Natronoglycomyces albus TaxID=2811108 RepID=A0A895XN87_9ACTN|nr:TerC/Alx family metal homeostasis membrane protein [Natronoglycomyces albus]QSB03936.1 TerC/Alx family metal homeostasis membrane protein [Natronoglycomyces albus]